MKIVSRSLVVLQVVAMLLGLTCLGCGDNNPAKKPAPANTTEKDKGGAGGTGK
jgi:hypothetical protein